MSESEAGNIKRSVVPHTTIDTKKRKFERQQTLKQKEIEMFQTILFGEINSKEMNDYVSEAGKGNSARTVIVHDISKSNVLELNIPDSYWDVFLPRLNNCKSSLYMDSFHGERHLSALETSDIGIPLLKELCRYNPEMLKQIIQVAAMSNTMDNIKDTVKRDETFMIPPAAIDEHCQNDTDSHGVTRIHEKESINSKTGYADECIRRTGFGHSHVSGVRVLVHRFKTDPEQKEMKWHIDDLFNSGWDGGYAVATVLLPGGRSPEDRVCTEINGFARKVNPNMGLWMPCNVMHRGIPTGDVSRNCIMLEFIAYGRNHTGAKKYKHEDVKDWLGLSTSQLLEMCNVDPMNAAAAGSMSYISAPVHNPYVVAFH